MTHVGRYVPAELRTALDLGPAPGFEGRVCSGCGKKYRLQRDHLDPICNGGITTSDNEDHKCWECHQIKSDAERAAGLYNRQQRE